MTNKGNEEKERGKVKKEKKKDCKREKKRKEREKEKESFMQNKSFAIKAVARGGGVSLA